MNPNSAWLGQQGTIQTQSSLQRHWEADVPRERYWRKALWEKRPRSFPSHDPVEEKRPWRVARQEPARRQPGQSIEPERRASS